MVDRGGGGRNSKGGGEGSGEESGEGGGRERWCGERVRVKTYLFGCLKRSELL